MVKASSRRKVTVSRETIRFPQFDETPRSPAAAPTRPFCAALSPSVRHWHAHFHIAALSIFSLSWISSVAIPFAIRNVKLVRLGRTMTRTVTPGPVCLFISHRSTDSYADSPLDFPEQAALQRENFCRRWRRRSLQRRGRARPPQCRARTPAGHWAAGHAANLTGTGSLPAGLKLSRSWHQLTSSWLGSFPNPAGEYYWLGKYFACGNDHHLLFIGTPVLNRSGLLVVCEIPTLKNLY